MKRRFLYTAERRGLRITTILFCALIPTLSFALQESTGPGGSNAQAVHALGYEGLNINIGFISRDNLNVSHEAFYEKDINGLPTETQHAFVYDTLGFGVNATTHDTQMAGIIVSNGGQSYPEQIGVAPKAKLHNIRVVSGDLSSSDLEAALIELITGHNCKVIVTGIALSGIDANGDSVWSKIYDYYAQTYDVVFANAAGNFESNVNVFGDAYNGITTGGLFVDANDIYHQVGAIEGSGSNSGPTVDGRKKPDIVSPSQSQWTPRAGSDSDWGYPPSSYHDRGQTSWAVPHTAGVAALLLDYADGSMADPDSSKSEAIKAVIVNSAFPNILDKSGNSTVEDLEAEPAWPWQTDRGYGRIDALRAYEILSSPKVTYSANKHQSVNTSTDQSVGWTYRIFNNVDIIDQYWISGTQNNRLVLTMAWNRKVNKAGSVYYAETSPMNLDMDIFDPQGVSVFSEHLDDTDPPIFNNLRKTDILFQSDGYYEVRITSTEKKNEDRSYAIAFELLEPLTADFDINYVVDVNDMAEFIPYWLETDCTIEPCLDYDLSPSPDNRIDLSDFSVFATQWLDYDSRYYSP